MLRKLFTNKKNALILYIELLARTQKQHETCTAFYNYKIATY